MGRILQTGQSRTTSSSISTVPSLATIDITSFATLGYYGSGYVAVYYNSSTAQSFTVPGSISKLRVTVVGGGGGGVNTTTNNSGGGGGGGYAHGVFTVTKGSSHVITVGAGGAKVSSANAGGGGTSSFGSLISATGGAGGVYNNPTVGAAGGVGSGGVLQVSGGIGGITYGGGGSAGNIVRSVGGGSGTSFSTVGSGGRTDQVWGGMIIASPKDLVVPHPIFFLHSGWANGDGDIIASPSRNASTGTLSGDLERTCFGGGGRSGFQATPGYAGIVVVEW
jgi:hypothetical protein